MVARSSEYTAEIFEILDELSQALASCQTAINAFRTLEELESVVQVLRFDR